MHFIRLASYGTLEAVTLDTPRSAMEGKYEGASCDDYLAWAAEERDPAKQQELLRRAYVADPDRAEEILGAARNIAIKRARKRAYGPGQKNGS